MTFELLMAIATLCQATGYAGDYVSAATVTETQNVLLKCQQEYIACVEPKKRTISGIIPPDALSDCVKERKPKGKTNG